MFHAVAHETPSVKFNRNDVSPTGVDQTVNERLSRVLPGERETALCEKGVALVVAGGSLGQTPERPSPVFHQPELGFDRLLALSAGARQFFGCASGEIFNFHCQEEAGPHEGLGLR